MKRLLLSVAIGGLILLQAACSLTPVSSRVPGYLTTPKGKILLSENGQCWRTAEWRPALAIKQCDPEVVAIREAEEAKEEEEKKKEEEKKAEEQKVVDDSGPHEGTEHAGFVYVSPEEEAKLIAAGATPEEARAAIAARAVPLSTPTATRTEIVYAPLVLNSDTSFRFNDDHLTTEGKDAVIEMAGIIKRRKGSDLKITVVGHTDRIGTDKKNLDLSRRRAATVKAALVAEGIPAAAIETAGMGASMPITQPDECPNYLVKCEMIECLRPDRRVEIKTRGKIPNGTRSVPLDNKQGSLGEQELNEGVLQFPRPKKSATLQREESICRA
ncbi:MAG: OmpA family protein [Pedobacter sp.]|nr:OmpA family protein [Pedobacter sp.]